MLASTYITVSYKNLWNMLFKNKVHCGNISLLYCSYISVIFGEDVAFGGVFRCTVGLRDKYGKLAFKTDIIFILV